MRTSTLYLWILISLYFSTIGHSKETIRYVEVKSIHEIASDVLYDTSDFWLIIDVDDTLLEGAQALTQFLWLQETIIGLQQLGFTENEAWNTAYPYWESIQEKGSVKTIEAALPLLISRLQEQGKTVFAYTERQHSTEEITIKQLKSLDINLVSSAPPVPETLPPNISFSSGVLFGGELRKGPGLQFFLGLMNTYPEKIIYIDNDKQNVSRIGELCKSKKISYFGITYLAQKFSPPIYLPEISKVQYAYEKKLLSNEAAALLLRHQMTE
ncbi:hypothetical protein BOKEGFJH_00487 [Chlamydia avium]|uniref:DUF2608 domain-containing protein n=1 Tax=Chlamydia avium TaxID=1457141 RepID=UPI0012BB45F8|nr:DUF2608 domain-containing protein [Chlamydia avium]VVT42961.1 hypothetical protein BOKEGFJH_00487 [Chlamydia avium]